ncbi:MAG: CPBP family intramembrane glutamic endopeptidase [Candidatus Zixiibacteriota bacterium]
MSWTLAAFGEEMVYRGYLLNRAADLGNRVPFAWAAGLFLTSIMFAFGHYYQGVTGMVDTGIFALFLGDLTCSRAKIFGYRFWPTA